MIFTFELESESVSIIHRDAKFWIIVGGIQFWSQSLIRL